MCEGKPCPRLSGDNFWECGPICLVFEQACLIRLLLCASCPVLVWLRTRYTRASPKGRGLKQRTIAFFRYPISTTYNIFRKDSSTKVPTHCLFFYNSPFAKDLAKRISLGCRISTFIFPSHFDAPEFGKEAFECGDFLGLACCDVLVRHYSYGIVGRSRGRITRKGRLKNMSYLGCWGHLARGWGVQGSFSVPS